ncbi:MAG: VTT domain-containing protein [Clostridia bacterium]|nr:VTT domain-containing protein [Clostridia bacterium]
MTKQKKQMKAIKLILLAAFILLLIFLTIKLFPLFKDLGSEAGRIEFKNKIDEMGILGPFMIIGLIFIQLLVAFLPGEPLEILAGMCYGTFGGMLLIFVGVFLSSLIVFFSVKKFGKDFIVTFFGEEGFKKIENNKLFKNPKKVELILFILFFIPGTPKDLFTYIGGMIPIKPLKFLLISTFARFPSIITSTFVGANITNGNLHLTIFSFVITIIISFIGLMIFNKIQKDN